MVRLITEERRVLTGSLHTIPNIHRLFQLHKCDWMARDPGTYREEIVWEFYASYAATLQGSIDKRSKPIAQDPFTSTMVRGFPVDISHTTISRFLYGPGPDHTWPLNTAKIDYRWDVVMSKAFTRNAEQREAVILWLAKYIAADGEHAEWVTASRLGIRKATLNFMAKFFWLLVRNRVSPTKVDNELTWDRAVMVETLVAGLEIDFARMLLADIHEKAFKTSTTYLFPCLILQLCRDSGVPIWHCDRLIHPMGTLDVGLIRDEANMAAPRRGPQIDVPLGSDLVDVVELMQGDEPAPPAHTDNAPASFSQAASQAPSSSRATPPSVDNVIPLVRVQKLEAQMETLMHHIKPWMQKLIVESEERVEKRMEAKTDQKVQAVHKRLDAFELRVLERPAPTIDMSSFRTELASIRADVDAILATPAVEPQATPVRIDVSTTEGAVRVTDSTTDGVVLVDAGTTKGDPSVD
uniref:Integrase core domain containing protein n=1 Tax=Solanum tuberosum TaxID=4113 RepID=M1DTP8_SOLTU